ncbi:MAG: hypothetical protein WBO73_00895 [Gammaproteobacteria bacterium]
MYYTDIKDYLRLKEQKDDVTGVCVVVIGILLAVMIYLVLMLGKSGDSIPIS